MCGLCWCDQGGQSGQKGLYSAYKEHTDCLAWCPGQAWPHPQSTALISTGWQVGNKTKYAGNKHQLTAY